MAVELPSKRFVDPYGGLDHLAAEVIDTPGTPEQSFSDDPLRMMRAARFTSQLFFTPAPRVIAAMTAMADRIAIVSAERVREELSKLLLTDRPRAGLGLLVHTGLADRVLPELPALRLETGRAPPAQGRVRAQPDRARAGHRPGVAAAGPAGPGQPAGRGAARHRQARHPEVRVGRQGVVPPPRRGRREAGEEAVDRAALQRGRDLGGEQADRAAPALPRVRRGGVDRLRRPPLRPRRRRPAGTAAHPDPRRLHHPEQGQGGPAAAGVRRARGADRRAGRRGGDRLPAAGPGRHPDHGDPGDRARSRGRRGVPVPAGAPDRRGPAGPRTGRGRPPHLVGRPPS